ncbi:MAG: DUF3795 domain-containing protein [Actinomycetia bacterium]|nr:DUF3795 domain-containing protein [Actinomycetes bacterium]
MVKIIKKYPTVGACGLDCGLCPRYYTKGPSRCPGCCGPDFFNKHPSCPFITCCVKKKNLEVCAECDGFPCSKFEGWDSGDSFVTHRKSISNLNSIKEQDMEEFIKQQMRRIELLEIMLKHFNEGRSKSFYCIAAALLSITDLEKSLKNSEQKIKADKIRLDNVKTKSKLLKGFLNKCAVGEVELKLRK